jgi:hypothetical protein
MSDLTYREIEDSIELSHIEHEGRQERDRHREGDDADGGCHVERVRREERLDHDRADPDQAGVDQVVLSDPFLLLRWVRRR